VDDGPRLVSVEAGAAFRASDEAAPEMPSAAPLAVEATNATLGGHRWLVCALLFLATTINYIDRQILSLLKPILDTELGWSNQEFGKVNAAFQGAYAVGLLLFGAFVDRYGTKIGYAVSITAWSLAAIGHAMVASVGGFFGARVALGLGEGGNFPSAIKAVAQWFPRKERAFATAVFNSGANVGAIVAPAVVPWMAFTWGWRSAFVAAGVAGFAWLLLWLPLYRRPGAGDLPREEGSPAPGSQAAKETNAKIGWRTILGHRQAWAFIVAKFLTDPVWWFFLIWLPDYFKKTRALDIKSSWVHLVSIYAIVTVLSIAGGWVTGYLTRRGSSVSRARKMTMFACACAVLPILLVTRAGDWSAVLLIGLAGAAHQAWSANLFTSASDMFPEGAVGSVVGLGGMAGSMGGIFFPIYSGQLLDRFQAAGNVTAGYAILFGICGSAYLVAFAIMHVLAPKFEPVPLQKVRPSN
jgi:MFS transporter, ACS family, hexuronate transporter